MQEQLFASFVLDDTKGLEIALKAENVTEATPVNGTIQQLPATIDYLEGIMNLRDKVIPIINLKKRLGLTDSEYSSDAKVAVVDLFHQQYGLLFDDIKEVFKAETSRIVPVSSALQTEDKIISALIQLEDGKRTVELLDLGSLFLGKQPDFDKEKNSELLQDNAASETTYSRWVVFACEGQEYGVPVEFSQEITFHKEIDDMFKSGNVEGALQLRGNTIPVLNSRYLLTDKAEEESEVGEKNRVLVLASDECSFGMLVEEVREILTVADDDILSVASGGGENVLGIYPRGDDRNVMLLDMPNLVCDQIEEIKSLSRIQKDQGKENGQESMGTSRSHHIITENCYLVFATEKNFAIELKDVQEIIESDDIMRVPGAKGYNSSIINLRGEVVPVVNTRKFYGYPDAPLSPELTKLIICKTHSGAVALEVDKIITIYKQEQYHSTPSLNPKLANRKDTLDRLIEFDGDKGIKEHVLVVNVHNLVRNHLELRVKNESEDINNDSENRSANRNQNEIEG